MTVTDGCGKQADTDGLRKRSIMVFHQVKNSYTKHVLWANVPRADTGWALLFT